MMFFFFSVDGQAIATLVTLNRSSCFCFAYLCSKTQFSSQRRVHSVANRWGVVKTLRRSNSLIFAIVVAFVVRKGPLRSLWALRVCEPAIKAAPEGAERGPAAAEREEKATAGAAQADRNGAEAMEVAAEANCREDRDKRKRRNAPDTRRFHRKGVFFFTVKGPRALPKFHTDTTPPSPAVPPPLSFGRPPAGIFSTPPFWEGVGGGGSCGIWGPRKALLP